MNFGDWFFEIEIFSFRAERFFEDIKSLNGMTENEKYQYMIKWLEAAYNVGFEHGVKSK